MADIASPSFDIGSIVAYDRVAVGDRNMGRADARRRHTGGRKAAIMERRIFIKRNI